MDRTLVRKGGTLHSFVTALGSQVAAALPQAARLPLEAGTDGPGKPSIAEFFPPPILFAGTPFEFTRINLVQIVATLVVVLLLFLGVRKLKVVPGRGQVITEFAFSFVRVNISEEILGEKEGKKYTPLLTWMFFVILAFNMCSVIPLLNISPNAVVATPFIFAIIAWIVFIRAGIKQHGAVGFFSASLFPKGVPWPIYILLTPIELLSTFILRPLTLTIRLWANMLAGHMLLVTFFLMTQWLIIDSPDWWTRPIGLVSFAAAFIFTLFEIFVAALQAYVFCVLTAVYISVSQAEEH